jgi:hypothetical protein
MATKYLSYDTAPPRSTCICTISFFRNLRKYQIKTPLFGPLKVELTTPYGNTTLGSIPEADTTKFLESIHLVFWESRTS